MVNRILTTSERFFNKQSTSILSAATIITGASLLSAVFGFIRNRLLVERFFATVELRQQLDAYWVAFRIPELVFQLLVIGAMSAAFIPVYSKYLERNEEDANKMTGTMLNLVMLTFLVISILIYFFAQQFNSLFTSTNFTQEQVDLAASLTRVMLLAQFAFAGSNFMTGVIQAHHRFLLPALSPLLYNVGIILGIIFLTPFLGIYGPAIGVVIGAVLHFLIQLPLALKLGFRFQPLFANYKHPGIMEMLRLLPTRSLTISINQIQIFASVYFATALPPGSLTVLNLAQQLMSAPSRIFSIPIGQASLPFLSKDANKKNADLFKTTLTQTLNQVMFLAFPASIILLVLRIPLVRIAYGAAQFPWSATLQTARLVAILSISVFAYGGIYVLSRAYYALHNTRIPFIIALVSVIFSILGMQVSSHFGILGIYGIGISLTAAALLEFILLFIVMIYKYNSINLSMFANSQFKIVFATAITGFSLWVPMRLLDEWLFDTTRTLPLIMLTIVVSLIGGAVYLGLAGLLKIPELAAFSAIFTKLSRWRSALSASDEVLETTSQTEEVKPW